MYKSLDEIKDVLANRELDDIKLKDIPPPNILKDSTKSALRVKKAIENSENISLIGDYDVDGIISTTIMKSFFNELKYPLNAIIPDRFTDGYGLSVSAIKKLDSPNLIITVDNGIAAIHASKYCKENGIDLIITDHHKVGDKLPNAYSIINPKQSDCNYPYSNICGAFVTWLFCAEVKKILNIDINMSKYLPLLAIATISDIMPMIGVNRSVVKSGMKMFHNSEFNSIRYLHRMVKKSNLLSDDIAFIIAPKLNSTGRLTKAEQSLDFLLEDDHDSLVDKFNKICEINEKRKDIEANIVKEVLSDKYANNSVIVASSSGWHEGVIGIVASKVATTYKKPTIIFNKTGDIYKGSGRSYNNIDLYSLVSKYKSLCLKFGGHKDAIGLSISKDNFIEFKNIIENTILNKPDTDSDKVIFEVDVNSVNIDLYDTINRYEPYGNKNTKPYFLLKEVTVVKSSTFVNKHKKIIVTNDFKNFLTVLDFNSTSNYNKGDINNFIVTLSWSDYSNEIETIIQKS